MQSKANYGTTFLAAHEMKEKRENLRSEERNVRDVKNIKRGGHF